MYIPQKGKVLLARTDWLAPEIIQLYSPTSIEWRDVKLYKFIIFQFIVTVKVVLSAII